MARTPRAKVPKTTGQGISRLSYQKGRRLLPGSKVETVKTSKVDDDSGSTSTSKRQYGKSKPKYDTQMNISYGSTLFPSDLSDIENFGKGRRR